MKTELIDFLMLSNPWLAQDRASNNIINEDNLITRAQLPTLLSPTWDKVWTVLIGPRQAGKTTLGLMLCQKLLQQQHFGTLIYLNCDEQLIRDWLKSPLFIKEATDFFKLKTPIFFIDEVQRLTNPGLLLKNIKDLNLPIKLIASGSSQLEIKSKVQEFLTGRHLEALILPFSQNELLQQTLQDDNIFIYGCYPDVVAAKHINNEKAIILRQLFNDYIDKDIIAFLKVGQPDVMLKLLGLIAHSSGQLSNFQKMATDLQVSTTLVKNYLSLLEKTYTIASIKPFVGNKRKEITSNTIYYFIDNGFRNQALNNFSSMDSRMDAGLLIQSFVFQEIMKYKAQNFANFKIHYWRTQSGAEVNFILYVNQDNIIPVEVKYQNMDTAQLSRSYYSFIEAYQPKIGFIVTKNYYGKIEKDSSLIYFIPVTMLNKLFELADLS